MSIQQQQQGTVTASASATILLTTDRVIVPMKIVTTNTSRVTCTEKHQSAVTELEHVINNFKRESAQHAELTHVLETVGFIFAAEDGDGRAYQITTIVHCVLAGTEKLHLLLNVAHNNRPRVTVYPIQHLLSEKVINRKSEQALEKASVRAHEQLNMMIVKLPHDNTLDHIVSITRETPPNPKLEARRYMTAGAQDIASDGGCNTHTLTPQNVLLVETVTIVAAISPKNRPDTTVPVSSSSSALSSSTVVTAAEKREVLSRHKKLPVADGGKIRVVPTRHSSAK